MNTFDRSQISSGVIIHDVIEDFNIQSMDFITRVPSWIIQALQDLNIQLQYIDVADKLEFTDYRCLIPDGCKYIRVVIIDKYKAELTDNPAPVIADSISYIPLAVSFPLGVYSIENEILDLSQLHRATNYTYSINGSYLHLNVANGELGLLYKRLPFVLDEVIKINVPLIPNNEVLKEALKLFVMTRILQRGYKHPVFNLRENNPFTNPALKYDSMKIKVRNACNVLTLDKRENCSRSLLNFLNLKNRYIS